MTAPTVESSGMIRFTVVVANAGGKLGTSSSKMITVVVDGLPRNTYWDSSAPRVRVTSPSVALSSSCSPEMVKLPEF